MAPLSHQQAMQKTSADWAHNLSQANPSAKTSQMSLSSNGADSLY